MPVRVLQGVYKSSSLTSIVNHSLSRNVPIRRLRAMGSSGPFPQLLQVLAVSRRERLLSSSFCTLSVAIELHLSGCSGVQWKRGQNRLLSHATGGSYPSKDASSAYPVGTRSESSATDPKAATGMWSSLSASHRAAGLIQSQLNYLSVKLPRNA